MLIPTTEFKYGIYPFSHFNYLQSLCFPFHTKNINLIVSASTSAGKTIVAEQNIAHMVASGKKAIFLSPLKAVTQEKYDDWTDAEHYFSKFKIEIITGDYRLTEARVASIQQANLILMTSEMLDTRTRYFNTENNAWLQDVGVIVIDEAHLLNTSRGPALEVGLMRFTQQNPSVKIVLLSATMSNTQDLSKWLTTLNRKYTEVIKTDWRPVELHNHLLLDNSYQQPSGRTEALLSILEVLTCSYNQIVKFLTSTNYTERTIAEIRMQGIKQDPESKEHTKTLVFVHSKNEGKTLCSALEDIGIKAYFHNADLGKSERLKLEKLFKEEDLAVLVATSTLAWGINMPARNVVVAGRHRGFHVVDDMDIKQMIGRAGRFGMYSRGDSFILSTPGYQLSSDFTIKSALADVNHLSFHIIAEMSNGSFNSLTGAEEWYKRSLSYNTNFQDNQPSLVRRAIESLVLCQALAISDNNTYQVTTYGKIARDLYLNPQDIFNWKKNFDPQSGIVLDWNDPGQIADALTKRISLFEIQFLPKELQTLTSAYKIHTSRFSTIKNVAYASVIWYRLTRSSQEAYVAKNFDGVVMPYFQLIIKDIGRVFAALHRLNSYENWHKEHYLKSLQARIVHGVGEHLLELVSIPGVGEAIATQLYNAGIHSLKALKAQKDNLDKIIARKANVTKILKGLEELPDNIQ